MTLEPNRKPNYINEPPRFSFVRAARAETGRARSEECTDV